jgi:hypothetical protein
MNEFFASPERRRRFFAFANLVPALVLGGGCSMLPVRWWPLDALIACVVLLLLVTSAIALFDARRADRALVCAASGLLAMGLVVVGAFALSMAFLSGVHGPFGAFGVALMGLVVLLLLPYAVVYPGLELLVFRARAPQASDELDAAPKPSALAASEQPPVAATSELDREAG